MKRFSAVLVLLSMVLSLTACKSEAEKQQEALVKQQMLAAQAQIAAANAQTAAAQTQQVAAPAVVSQPVIIQTPPADHSLALGMLVGAAAYAAFDPFGHVRSGYYVVEGRVYPNSFGYGHTYARTHHITETKTVQITKVTNNITNNTVVNKTGAPAAPAAATPAAAAPLTKEQKDAKKNAGDAAAEKERVKMK
jgi:hypothetical protein